MAVANGNETQEPEPKNKMIVELLYKALADGEMNVVEKVLASDLEYWFHGPPRCQHMMMVLTGESTNQGAFRFEPRSIEVVGDCVIAEGWEGEQAYWVHVWTVKEGLITQFREYFNTWLIVRDLKPIKLEMRKERSHGHRTLWQSQPRDLARRSLPGLLLAI